MDLEAPKKVVLTNRMSMEVKKLVRDRDDARKSGDYARADAIRAELLDTYDVKIEDRKTGTTWYR